MTTTRQPPVPAARPGPPARRRGRLRTFARGRWLKTIPGRIRASVALLLALLALMGIVLTVAVGNARQGVQTMGHDAGPQVVATGALYFALSDMDAQVADVLLIGRDHGLGIGHDESLRRYEQRRDAAAQAAVQAAQLAGQDAKRQQNVRDVLNGLGRYEQLAGEAMLLNDQSGHAAGPPPGNVLRVYRQATDLMKLELLPKAYNLTLDSGATVRQSYESKRAAVLSGRAWVVLTAVLVLAALAVAQLYLARGFRRTVNPGLALATLLTLVLAVAAFAQLSAQAEHLRVAKRDGFDSVLSLSRARAISHSAFADESRYLLDPDRADTYEQTYLDKALAVLYVDPGQGKPVNLETYYATLDRDVRGFTPGRARFLGFFGDEAHQVRPAGAASDALGQTLRAYLAVQQNDRRMRELAGRGDRAGAIRLRMGTGPGGAIRAFDDYDRALVSLSETHRRGFDAAIAAGDGGLRGWKWLPLGAALVIAALILAGVRPRLAEFR
ncbi:hypothetical protein [Actinomadura macrotermitis]|uniref:Secreted protein n=1 Tax=Actinomadura macrotermitis TaxID=2585200 RepID=A0A7K0BUZ2_9ACTN|nr:hypothetical protein [Actinomadura macrotermitis]MQY04981.1 hypothetical protein [Actinomadura macrotermitis]